MYLRFGKRLFDLVLVIPALIFLTPAFAVIGLLVRWRLGSPVFFRQLRPGLDRQPFTLLKFRTMTEARDEDWRMLPDSQRLRPFGRFLRRFSFDELPELFNVLKGDMSLVGPRPLLMEYVERYSVDQARRHAVRPGVTGWAQVNGRNALSWDEKFELDVWYVDHAGFFLDVKILAMTTWQVVIARGINAEGHATMPAFKGRASDDR